MPRYSINAAWHSFLFYMYVLCVLLLLSKTYASESPLIVAAGLLSTTALTLFPGALFERTYQAVPAILLILFAFAPPSIIFDVPVELAGIKLLPAYGVALGYICYKILTGAFARAPWQAIVWCGFLLLFAVAQLAIVHVHGFAIEIVESVIKSTALIALLSILCCFAVIDLLRKVGSRYALYVLIVVLFLQIYQLYIFLLRDGADGLFWFGDGGHWLRFGHGYGGDLFNPARAYALAWDPNYLISLTLPMFLVATRAELGMRRVWIEFVFALSVLLTLSYQSAIIMFLAIFLSRSDDFWIAWFRKIARACALLLPLGCVAFYLSVEGGSLPPPEMASSFERAHIIWAVGHALTLFPFGIGFGAFEFMALSEFFAGAMMRTLPPHGWLFELMIGGGLIGYYVLVLLLFRMTRNIGKEGGIALLGFVFWGVTSPAITTPYFWIFFGAVFVAGGNTVGVTKIISNLQTVRCPPKCLRSQCELR